MSDSSMTPRKAIVLGPGQGRAYPMGRICALFKADEAETQSRYSVSEWWLEARTQGPGAHSHAEDDLFYVIEGVMSHFAARDCLRRRVNSGGKPHLLPAHGISLRF